MALFQVQVFQTDGVTVQYKQPVNFFSLDWLQAQVGGLIEFYPTPSDSPWQCIVNEEGLIKGLPLNKGVKKEHGLQVYGPAIVVPKELAELL